MYHTNILLGNSMQASDIPTVIAIIEVIVVLYKYIPRSNTKPKQSVLFNASYAGIDAYCGIRIGANRFNADSCNNRVVILCDYQNMLLVTWELMDTI